MGKSVMLEESSAYLEEALDKLHVGRVIEILLFIHLNDLLDPLIPADVATTRAMNGPRTGVSVATFNAVAAALVCNRIGGCSATNPMVLQVCALLPERPCFRPNNISDAIEQAMTGFELAHF